MALKDLVIPKVEVEVAGGSFAVRGLSATDIEMLLRTHGNDVKVLWDEFLADNTDLTKLEIGQITPLLKKVVARIPSAVIDIIVLAADADEEEALIVARLPIGAQVSAIGAVLSVTLGTDGDWSKMMETATSLLAGMNAGMGELTRSQSNP